MKRAEVESEEKPWESSRGLGETRRLPRPKSLPLPDCWSRAAGVYVHASGDSIETFDELDDAELGELRERFADAVALVTWEQRERAVRRINALSSGAEVEA